MSIQAIAWVLEESEATLADRLVLLAIANHADGRGWNAWPTVPQIAREARVDRATVFRALGDLEASGELCIERRRGRSNMYGITAMMGSQIATGRGSQDATGKGSQIATGGVANCDERGRRMRPEPSLTVNEPSRAPARAREAAPTTQPKLPPELPAEVRARGAEFFRALRTGE